jgi:hypothetical protein
MPTGIAAHYAASATPTSEPNSRPRKAGVSASAISQEITPFRSWCVTGALTGRRRVQSVKRVALPPKSDGSPEAEEGERLLPQTASRGTRRFLSSSPVRSWSSSVRQQAEGVDHGCCRVCRALPPREGRGPPSLLRRAGWLTARRVRGLAPAAWDQAGVRLAPGDARGNGVGCLHRGRRSRLGMQGMGSSTDSFDEWFRARVLDIHGFDLANPPGPPPEQVLDYRA